MTPYDDWIARARAVPIEEEVRRRGIKLKRDGAEWIGPCPRCGGDDRFSIHPGKAVWNCRGCKTNGTAGDVIGLVMNLDGVDFIGAVERLTDELAPRDGKHSPASREVVVGEYFYQDAGGTDVFAVERHEWRYWDETPVLKGGKVKKTFRQKRPDPDHPGAWLRNVDGVPVVPYRLPRVTEAVAAGQPVLIVEGERKADLLAEWHVAATCNAGGSGKWRAEHSAYLHDADVVLLPDSDDAGFKHVNDVGASLAGIAKRIRVLILPNLPAKGDVVDWAKAGGTREALDQLIETTAHEWQPPSADAETVFADKKAKAEADETALIEALARMKPGIKAARERKRLAKELGVPGSAIDAEVERIRDENPTVAPLYSHWEVTPYPEEVDGDSLLGDIIRRLQKHVACSPETALAAALWLMLTWVFNDAAIHGPILLITSAEPSSGKTTLLNLLSYMARRCIASVDISEAALFRSIKHWQPSFCIDEFDKALASEDKNGLCTVINSGHVKGQGVIRCLQPNYVPENFSTFCAKAIGMIGRRLPDATLTRCIIVELRKKKRADAVEKFRHEDDTGLADLRSRLARWTADNVGTLRAAAQPGDLPPYVEDRVVDNWALQFRIADLCGLDWGEKARAAAVRLEDKIDKTTLGAKLLADIKAQFEVPKEDAGRKWAELSDKDRAISSAAMVELLIGDPDKLWVEVTKGKPLTQNRLARMLSQYSITTQTVWLTTEQSLKGYKRSQFEDAWERNLPARQQSSKEK